MFDGWQWAFKVKEGDAILQNADGGIFPGDWVRINYLNALEPSADEITCAQ